MWLEDLFPWVRRDSIHLTKDEEGVVIAKRLQELAASEKAEDIKQTAAEFPTVKQGY
jgi:hypothetical protein